MDELRGNELKLAYWLNTNRDLIKKIGYGIFIFVNVIIWIPVLINVITYIVNYKATQFSYTSPTEVVINYDSLQAPVSIKTLDTGVTEKKTGIYDAYALVKNPNLYYAARFDYTFTVAGNTVTLTNGFALPEQEIYLVASGFASEGNITSSPTIKIENVSWQRIKGKRPEVEFLISDIDFGRIGLNSTVVEPEVTTDLTGASEVSTSAEDTSPFSGATGVPTSDTPSGTSSKSNANNEADIQLLTPDDVIEDAEDTPTPEALEYSRATANVFNNSALGFRSVYVIVILKDSTGNIQAIGQQILKDLNSFDEQQVLVSWDKKFAIDVKPEFLTFTDSYFEENLIYPGDE
ncbi:MAG: hypothetical protein Q8P90_03640 [bacterium]|nr:hypothetical protein [bacterium]